jgi:hypothetical protein
MGREDPYTSQIHYKNYMGMNTEALFMKAYGMLEIYASYILESISTSFKRRRCVIKGTKDMTLNSLPRWFYPSDFQAVG